MKNYLLLVCLLVGVSLGCSAQAGCELVINLRDGSSVSYALSARPHISHSGQEVEFSTYDEVSTTDESISVYRSQVRSLTFTDGISTAITASTASVPRPTFSIDGNVLRVKGLAPGSCMSVHGLDGLSHGSATADGNGCATLSLCSSAKIFVVKTPVISFKVVKK